MHIGKEVSIFRIHKELLQIKRACPVVPWVKNPPAVQETQEMPVPSLGWEDPLEKGMATQSSPLAWKNPWTEEPGGIQFMGLQGFEHD